MGLGLGGNWGGLGIGWGLGVGWGLGGRVFVVDIVVCYVFYLVIIDYLLFCLEG